MLLRDLSARLIGSEFSIACSDHVPAEVLKPGILSPTLSELS